MVFDSLCHIFPCESGPGTLAWIWESLSFNLRTLQHNENQWLTYFINQAVVSFRCKLVRISPWWQASTEPEPDWWYTLPLPTFTSQTWVETADFVVLTLNGAVWWSGNNPKVEYLWMLDSATNYIAQAFHITRFTSWISISSSLKWNCLTKWSLPSYLALGVCDFKELYSFIQKPFIWPCYFPKDP